MRDGLRLYRLRPDTGVPQLLQVRMPWPQKVSPLRNSLRAGISDGRLSVFMTKLPSEHLSHTCLIAYIALSSMEAGRQCGEASVRSEAFRSVPGAMPLFLLLGSSLTLDNIMFLKELVCPTWLVWLSG